MVLTATASFTGVEESVAVVWSTPFLVAPSVTHGVGVTDGQTVDADVISVTTTGCTVVPTGPFAGKVELIASD